MSNQPGETPRLVNAAERRVWEALTAQSNPGDLVIPGKRVTDHLKDHEVDFVVASRAAASSASRSRAARSPTTGTAGCRCRDGRDHEIEPVRQAREACYALRDFIENDPRWTQRRLRWDHVVVFPTSRPRRTSRCRSARAGRSSTATTSRHSSTSSPTSSIDQELDRPLLTQQGIEQLSTASERQGIAATRRRRPRDGQRGRRRHADRTSVGHPRRDPPAPRVEVRGGAGSGKTFLAMEQARRLAQRGQRVALVCYSHGLASYLERITATWPRRQQPAYVGEFHALGVKWGAPEGPDESIAQRRDRPVLGARPPAANGRPGSATRARPPVRRRRRRRGPGLRRRVVGPAAGVAARTTRRWHLRVQRRGPAGVRPPRLAAGALVPLILDHNLRNTRQIANAFQPLVDHPMRFLGGDGPAVTFVAVRPRRGDGCRRRPGRSADRRWLAP